MKRKILSLILATALACGSMSSLSFAAEEPPVIEGSEQTQGEKEEIPETIPEQEEAAEEQTQALDETTGEVETPEGRADSWNY